MRVACSYLLFIIVFCLLIGLLCGVSVVYQAIYQKKKVLYKLDWNRIELDQIVFDT